LHTLIGSPPLAGAKRKNSPHESPGQVNFLPTPGADKKKATEGNKVCFPLRDEFIDVK
jgi:hypothetical protein